MEQVVVEGDETDETALKDSLLHEIDALLVKLREHGEESFLLTANTTTIHVIGSNKGKTFLSQNQDLAMKFHNFCYDESAENKADPDTSVVHASPSKADPDTSIVHKSPSKADPDTSVVHKSPSKADPDTSVVHKSPSKADPDTSVVHKSPSKADPDTSVVHKSPSKADPDTSVVHKSPSKAASVNAKPRDSTSKTHSSDNKSEETSKAPDISLRLRGRGRPRKVAKKADKQRKDSSVDSEEEREETKDRKANSKEKSRSSSNETECKVSRSGRRIKRKTFESLGFVSQVKKKRKITFSPDEDTSDTSIKSPSKAPKTSKRTKSEEKIGETKKSVSAEDEDEMPQNEEKKGKVDSPDTEQSKEMKATPGKKRGQHLCQTCGEKFPTQEMIENHLRLKHPDVWSKILEEETDILVSLGKKDHVSEESVHANKTRCVGKRRSAAEVKEEEVLLDCEECEAKFKNTRSLERHVKLMHSEVKPTLRKPVSNMDEEKDNLDEKELENYSENEDIKDSKSKSVNSILWAMMMKVTEKTYKEHENFVTGSEFQCYSCNSNFESIALLIKHMKETRHDGLDENSKEKKREIITVKKKKTPTVYKCSVCRVEYFIRENCVQHVKDNNCKPMWKKSCPMRDCELSFDNNNFFMNHMKTFHNTDYPFFCASCNKSYLRIREYESHCSYHKRINNSLVNPNLPVMCNECGLRFLTNFEVNSHKLEVHESNKKFICETCGRKFRREDNMKLHLKTHQKREDNPDFQCKVCKKFLCSKDSLKLHTKFMHSEEKPCVCEICGHRTRQMGSLRHHMKVRHSDDRPYQCEWKGCDKSFKIYQVWQSHSQSHALAEGDVDKAKSFGRLQFCKICEQHFPCRADMNNHMLIHSNEKTIQCDICHTTLKRWGSLKRHMMNVHNKLITGGLSAMQMQDGYYPRLKPQKKVITIRKPRPYHPAAQTQVNSSTSDIPEVTIIKRQAESPPQTEAKVEYHTEGTYEFQHSDAQEKLLQILAEASSDITKMEEASSASNPTERDYATEADSQAEILEGVKEYHIEEATNEVCLDSTGEQVIYLNSLPNDIISANNAGGVIYAVRNSDGSLSLQLTPENS